MSFLIAAAISSAPHESFMSAHAIEIILGGLASVGALAAGWFRKQRELAKKGQQAERHDKETAEELSRDRKTALDKADQALQEMGFWKNTAEAFKNELEAVKQSAERALGEVATLRTEVGTLTNERSAVKNLGISSSLGQQILDCLREQTTDMHEFRAEITEVMRFISSVQIQQVVDSPPPKRPRTPRAPASKK